MPDKEDGHNRGRKYPFITGEIFNCEINQILDKFFEAPPPVQLSLKGDDDEVEKEKALWAVEQAKLFVEALKNIQLNRLSCYQAHLLSPRPPKVTPPPQGVTP